MAEYDFVIGFKAPEMDSLLTQFYEKPEVKEQYFKGNFLIDGSKLQWELPSPLQAVFSCPEQSEWDHSFGSDGKPVKCVLSEDTITIELEGKSEKIPMQTIFQIVIPECGFIHNQANSTFKQMKFLVSVTVLEKTNSVSIRLLAFYKENISILDKIVVCLFIPYVFQALEKLVSCIKLPLLTQKFFMEEFTFRTPEIFIRDGSIVFAVRENSKDVMDGFIIPEDDMFVLLSKDFTVELMEAVVNNHFKGTTEISDLIEKASLPGSLSVSGTLTFNGADVTANTTDLVELIGELLYGLDMKISALGTSCSVTKAADTM